MRHAFTRLFALPLICIGLTSLMGCGTPVSGEVDIGTVLAEGNNAIECECSCEIPIASSAISEFACGAAGGTAITLPDGTTTCATTQERTACLDPTLAGDDATLSEYCDAVCDASESGLEATYGCDSTCTQVQPASDYTTRVASYCVEDCVAEPCEDCLDVGLSQFKSCLASCNSTEGVCGEDPVGPVCMAPVDPPGTVWLDHTGGIVGDIIGYEARGDVDSGSWVDLAIDGLPVSADVSGSVSVIGPPCDGTTCDSAIRVALDVDDFPLPGLFSTVSVENLKITGTSAINAIALDSGGSGEIEPGDFIAVVSFDLDGWIPFPPFTIEESVAYEITNDVALPVEVDWSRGTVSLYEGISGSIVVGIVSFNFDVDFDVEASFEQTGPVFDAITLPTWAECDTTDGARIDVSVTGTDQNQADDFNVRWWTEPDIFTASPDLEEASGEIIVPLGDSDVTVFLGDATGRGTFYRETVQVVDITFATMDMPWSSAGGLALELKPAKVASSLPVGTLEPLFTDDCDPAPEVTITRVKARSKDTQILHEVDGGLCIDAVKRTDGVALDYEVSLEVTDSAGNVAKETVKVTLCEDTEKCDLPLFETRTAELSTSTCTEKRPLVSYKAKPAKGEPAGKGLSIRVKGDLRSGELAEDFVFDGATRRVAGVASGGAGESGALWTEYAIKTGKNLASEARSIEVVAHGDCGAQTLEVDQPTGLLLPASAGASGSEPGAGLACFVVRGADKPAKGTQVRAGGLDGERLYDLVKPSRLCVPVDVESAAGIVERTASAASEDSVLCYKAKLARKEVAQGTCGPATPGDRGERLPSKQPRHEKRAGLLLGDPFGTTSVDTVKEVEVCRPVRVACSDCAPTHGSLSLTDPDPSSAIP